MKIAITGGTGFVGRHLARDLVRRGHRVALIARGWDRRDERVRELDRATFIAAGVDHPTRLEQALRGCDVVAHCAGINREIGSQTFQRIHIDGTRNVIEVARRAGAKKILFLSFLRARPNCGSAYHESKWAAEELIRNSSLDYTILKSGMIYGSGDHMLDHLSHAFHTLPVFASVGFKAKVACPVAVQDLVAIIRASLVDGRLSHQTVAVMGPERLPLTAAVRRVAQAIGKSILIFPLPVFVHRILALGFELTMKVPLVARAQVRILNEDMTEALPPCDALPPDLAPSTAFNIEQIRAGLPPAERFGLKDVRWCSRVDS